MTTSLRWVYWDSNLILSSLKTNDFFGAALHGAVQR